MATGHPRRRVFPAIAALLLCTAPAFAVVELHDRLDHTPLVLNTDADYVLRNVAVTDLTDAAALTLTGNIRSIRMSDCRFGQITAGPTGRAAALEAAAAAIGSLIATDCYFQDAEHQLISLREGTFATVRFERCSFRTTDAFLRRIYASSPARTTPPIMEFYNIQKLELLDNDYANTRIIIHPSVKQVILRGPIASLHIANPQQTRVIRLDDHPPIIAALPAPSAATIH